VLVPDAVPVLETERMQLRALAPGDREDVFAVFSDPAVMRFWSSEPMTQLAQADALIERAHGHVAEHAGLRWAMVRREDGRVLGTVSMFAFSDQNRRAEIGYAQGREHWGRGYMREALGAVVAWGFETLGLHRLEADTDPRNEGSLRLLEGLGFVREGLLRERWIVNGEICDSAYLGLLKRDWRARPPG
jgi:RimJ/RimL family protein N-acetyltransferase